MIEAKALKVKTLQCSCGGVFEHTDYPYDGCGIAHKCSSCGFIGFVMGQVFPETVQWKVKVKGITEEEE